MAIVSADCGPRTIRPFPLDMPPQASRLGLFSELYPSPCASASGIRKVSVPVFLAREEIVGTRGLEFLRSPVN